MSEQLGFDKGFERFIELDTLYRRPRKRCDIDQVVDLAESWIFEESARPFFAFIHSYEAHGPFLKWRGEEVSSDAVATEDFDMAYFNFDHMKGQRPVPLSEIGEFVKILGNKGEEVSLGRGGVD